MSVALSLTGSLRTLNQPCVRDSIFQRIAVPLSADIFACINVPKRRIAQTRKLLIKMSELYKVRLLKLDIYAEGIYQETNLSRNYLSDLGHAQAEGLVRCGRAILAHSYAWAIRARTDLYIPFRIQTLPSAKLFSKQIWVGFVGKRCNSNTAWWSDDRFALIPTQAVQKAYFLGYAHDFGQRRCANRNDCYAPECKIGLSLESRNIQPLDLRRTPLGERNANIQIIRHNCTVETRNKNWIVPWPNEPSEMRLLPTHTLTRGMNNPTSTGVRTQVDRVL
jgi:hypothetical protein